MVTIPAYVSTFAWLVMFIEMGSSSVHSPEYRSSSCEYKSNSTGADTLTRVSCVTKLDTSAALAIPITNTAIKIAMTGILLPYNFMFLFIFTLPFFLVNFRN